MLENAQSALQSAKNRKNPLLRPRNALGRRPMIPAVTGYSTVQNFFVIFQSEELYWGNIKSPKRSRDFFPFSLCSHILLDLSMFQIFPDLPKRIGQVFVCPDFYCRCPLSSASNRQSEDHIPFISFIKMKYIDLCLKNWVVF